MDSEGINPARKTDFQGPNLRVSPTGSRTSPASAAVPVKPVDTVSLSSAGKKALEQAGPTGSVSRSDAGGEASRRKFTVTEAHDVVLKIVDNKTREVVKQIPSQEELRIRDAIRNVVDDFSENDSSQ